jgi:hypothetical protein
MVCHRFEPRVSPTGVPSKDAHEQYFRNPCSVALCSLFKRVVSRPVSRRNWTNETLPRNCTTEMFWCFLAVCSTLRPSSSTATVSRLVSPAAFCTISIFVSQGVPCPVSGSVESKCYKPSKKGLLQRRWPRKSHPLSPTDESPTSQIIG